MTFDESIEYMQNLQNFGIKLGNQRFLALMELLGRPDREYKVAHVAGTKGKGSTTAMIDSILRSHRLRVGSYYSPFVYNIRERIMLNGAMITTGEFARFATIIQPFIAEMAKQPDGQTTEFEFKTAMGFLAFAQFGAQYAVIETGLGGRLDATNICEPTVTTITNIGLDHMHILGNSHAEIAAEKAGIIKRGIPLITSVNHPTAFAVIDAVAQSKQAVLRRCREDNRISKTDIVISHLDDECFEITTERNHYAHLAVGMGGGFQRWNAACAIGAVEELEVQDGFEIDTEAVRSALLTVTLPGRMEIIRRSPTVIADGAHNELSVRALAYEIERMSFDRLLLITGMIQGHEPKDVVTPLANLASEVYATRPSWRTSLPAEEVASAARKVCTNTFVYDLPQDALDAAFSSAGPNDLILITGSFYLIGDMNWNSILPIAEF